MMTVVYRRNPGHLMMTISAFFLHGKKHQSHPSDGEALVRQWGQVIAGWDVALMKLSQGEKAVVTVPSALAYGPRGYGSLGEAMDSTIAKAP